MRREGTCCPERLFRLFLRNLQELNLQELFGRGLGALLLGQGLEQMSSRVPFQPLMLADSVWAYIFTCFWNTSSRLWLASAIIVCLFSSVLVLNFPNKCVCIAFCGRLIYCALKLLSQSSLFCSVCVFFVLSQHALVLLIPTDSILSLLRPLFAPPDVCTLTLFIPD